MSSYCFFVQDNRRIQMEFISPTVKKIESTSNKLQWKSQFGTCCGSQRLKRLKGTNPFSFYIPINNK